MDVSLRDFRVGDFEELWRIDQECFPPGVSYSRRELAVYLRTRGAFAVIAESGGRNGPKSGAIMGFIVGEASRKGVGHVITIDVVQNARHSGIGSRLLVAAEKRFRIANCRLVRLEASVGNSPALAFYKRHGYAVTRTIPKYYSSGEDAFVLEKIIGEQLDSLPSEN